MDIKFTDKIKLLISTTIQRQRILLKSLNNISKAILQSIDDNIPLIMILPEVVNFIRSLLHTTTNVAPSERLF